jgi:hypothetical protein
MEESNTDRERERTAALSKNRRIGKEYGRRVLSTTEGY